MEGVYDCDLEGMTEEEKRATLERHQRMKAQYNCAIEKKSDKIKAKEVEKSIVVLEVKPWDETVDLESLWKQIVEIEQDGLQWGESFQLEPVFGNINKLVMSSTIVDSLVMLDDIIEKIVEFEDYVQSVDVRSMTKL